MVDRDWDREMEAIIGGADSNADLPALLSYVQQRSSSPGQKIHVY